MDPFSHRLANALVGNPRHAATLEVALLGPEIEFDDERVVAVTGAEFALTVDNGVAPYEQPFVVSAKSRLHFGARSRGARAYLAVDGGFDVPLVLGSRATHVFSGMGGWMGRALQRGDRVPLGPANSHGRQRLRGPSTTFSDIMPPAVVRALPGPDRHRFVPEATDALQSGPYVISGESDRMGFRLQGPSVRHAQGADIISEATPVGSLQVPGSGQPVLLMADRQTTGGYPKIATVITADIGIAAQAAPGEVVTFRLCTPSDALAALIARERRLISIETTS